MNICIFNKKYIVRRFDEQEIYEGYVTAGHKDIQVSLNVHPLSSDQMLALPEGERRVKRLEGHGTDVLVVADQSKNQKGDLLYYHGEWYECVSAQEFDHTLLSHWNYQFVLVPTDAAGSPDTEKLPSFTKEGEGDLL